METKGGREQQPVGDSGGVVPGRRHRRLEVRLPAGLARAELSQAEVQQQRCARLRCGRLGERTA